MSTIDTALEMMEAFVTGLTSHLRDHRSDIVRKQDVKEEWHDSYGGHEMTTTIDVVSFDALLASMDEFSAEFKTKLAKEKQAPSTKNRDTEKANEPEFGEDVAVGRDASTTGGPGKAYGYLSDPVKRKRITPKRNSE